MLRSTPFPDPYVYQEGDKLVNQEGVLSKTVRLFRGLAEMRIALYASHACYFIVLAVFPALVLLLSLLRYIGLDVNDFTQALEGIIPLALLPTVKKVILSTYQASSGAVVSVSAVAALWSASRGIYGLLTGLNAIYKVSENRGYWYTRGVSVIYTFFFLIVLVLTLMLHVFGNSLLNLMPKGGSPFWYFLTEVIDLRFFLLLFIQTALFTAVFMVFPNKRNQFFDSLPGAIFASCGWLVMTDLFSTYVAYFPNYANIYGSVYAVALSLLWLYICISIVFYGGALNYLLAHSEKKEE